jgi:hypothetical protein
MSAIPAGSWPTTSLRSRLGEGAGRTSGRGYSKSGPPPRRRVEVIKSMAPAPVRIVSLVLLVSSRTPPIKLGRVVGVNSSASQITGMRAGQPAGGPEGRSRGKFSFVVLSELSVRLGFASFSMPELG